MKASILASTLALLLGLTGCIKGRNNFLYTAGPGTNEVFAFAIHGNGSITALGTPNFAVGSQPSSIVIHPPGDFVYITNFAGANLTQLNINSGNGDLVVPPTNSALPPLTPANLFNTGGNPVAAVISSSAPHLYVLNQSPGNISAFLLDPSLGGLSTITNPPGNPAGAISTYGTLTTPTSMAITPNGALMFVASPSAGTVSAFAVNNNDGSLAEVAGSPFAVGGAGAAPAWVAVDSTGKSLYVADSAHNAVLGFSIGTNGTLTPIAGSPFAAGANPTHLAVSANGALLFASNTNDNTVSAYVIDQNSGALGAVAGSPFATGGKGPGYLLATGATLFVSDTGTNDIAALNIGPNGVLAAASGSPFGVPVSPAWIAVASE
jgi:6-phosphogluconolactonase (cycloisomerase 2 family)